MKQPSSIPQYKQFCKALKLKILKQKSTIQIQLEQIQKLNNEIKILKKQQLHLKNDINNSDCLANFKLSQTIQNNNQITDLQTLKGRNNVMNKFKKGACHFGITPQSIFRIADFSYKNQVQSDYFRKVLSKIDLGLTQMQISTLIYIFDENCTGYIYKDNYNDSLNAYAISLQQSYLPYNNLCLQKLAKLIESQKYQIIKFYQDIQGKNNINGIQLNKFQQKIKNIFGNKLQMKQIMGAFNAIDLQNDGLITKKNFLYSVTAAINKLSNSLQMKKTGQLAVQQTPTNPYSQFQRSTLSNKKSHFHINQNQNNNSKFNQASKFLDKNDASPSKISVKNDKQEPHNTNDQQQVINKIQKQNNITLYQIYQQICRNSLAQRLTLFNFKKIINTISKQNAKVDPELSSFLFRLMDFSKRGTIHYKQLIYFYLRHENDMSIIFNILGIYFKNSDLNSQKFWFINGVTSDSDITKTKFLQTMTKTFGNDDLSNSSWQKLWNYFDKGRGIISITTINRQLNKYEICE